MSCKVYVDDTGTELLIDVGPDISTATIFEINVKKPDNTIETWPVNPAHWPGIDDDHPANVIKYIINTGNLNLAGSYKIQPYIEMPTWTGSGETSSFQVWPKFQ